VSVTTSSARARTVAATVRQIAQMERGWNRKIRRSGSIRMNPRR